MFHMQTNITAQSYICSVYLSLFCPFERKYFTGMSWHLVKTVTFSLFIKKPTSKMFLLKKFYTIKIYMLCILHSRSLKYKSLLCYATLTHQIRFSCSRFKRLELFTQAFKISYGKQVTCRRLDILTYIKKAKQVLQLEKYIHTFEDLLLKQQIYDNFRMQNSKCK